MRTIVVALAALTVLIHCRAQYRPLEAADGCACKPGEYCKVSQIEVACMPLPKTCGARPSCDCVGSRGDACRDEDGRITLLPPRNVPACDSCSAEEFCAEESEGATCRVIPPQCEDTRSCACLMEHTHRLACAEKNGRLVATGR